MNTTPLRGVLGLALGLGCTGVSAQILAPAPAPAPAAPFDWRDIQFGSVIPDEEYVDQPYILRSGAAELQHLTSAMSRPVSLQASSNRA